MDEPLRIKDHRNICRSFGLNPDRNYFDTISVGKALWKAFVEGQKSNQQIQPTKHHG